MTEVDLFSYQEETQKKKKLYLIDGMGFLFRSFFAIKAPLRTEDGKFTNAVYGFARALLKVLREHEPDYLAVAFDAPGKTFREEAFPEYKANRPEPPQEFIYQIPMAIHLAECLNIPLLFVQGFEADDVIATLAEKVQTEGLEVVIISSDKDLMQLIGPQVKMFDPIHGEKGKWYSEKEVKDRFGTDPLHVPDALSLIGDTADNIPGVPGIGDKTAKKLMEQYGSLENLYENIDALSGKIKNSLIDKKEQAFSCRSLLTLRKDVPLNISIDDLKRKPYDNEVLRKELLHLSFLSLLRELNLNENKTEEIKFCYTIVRDINDLGDLLQKIQKEGCFSFDLTTQNNDILKEQLVGIAISLKEKENYFIPFNNLIKEINDFNLNELQRAVKSIFEDNNLKKLGFDLKKSIQIFHKNNIDFQGIEMDIMVVSYLINTDFTNHSLEKIAERFISNYVLSIGKSDTSIKDSDWEVIIQKSCQRAEMIRLIYPIFREKLKEHSLDTLYQQIEQPLISVLARMEERGIAINSDVFKELEEEINSRIVYLEQEIYKQAGMKFNINSPKQLQVVLFEKLGLKPVRKTKTGASTDMEVLEELAVIHPLPAIIIEYRTLQKLLNTYIETLPKLVRPETGRIHTNFNQTVVATGRLSSSDPNLQNIPIRTEYGKRIREGFVATDENWKLISADYSQIELRILAHLSEDPILCEAFYNDRDIHRETASKVFGIPFEKVTEQQRRQAKAINFGVIYGMTPYGLSKAVGFSTSEAGKFIDAYFTRFSRVREWLDKTIEEAKNKGFTTTLFNRRRYISGLDSANQIIRKSAERMAVNTPVQGSAADIIKKAMIEVNRYLRDVGAYLLLQVHDELLIETPKNSARETANQVKSIMEKVVSLRVPLKVEIGMGNNWAEAH